VYWYNKNIAKENFKITGYFYFVTNCIAVFIFCCVILIPVHRNSLVRFVILFCIVHQYTFFCYIINVEVEYDPCFERLQNKKLKPGFCSWVYWLLKVQLYSAVKVCDARNDAIKIYGWAQKNSTVKFGLKYSKVVKQGAEADL